MQCCRRQQRSAVAGVPCVAHRSSACASPPPLPPFLVLVLAGLAFLSLPLLPLPLSSFLVVLLSVLLPASFLPLLLLLPLLLAPSSGHCVTVSRNRFFTQSGPSQRTWRKGQAEGGISRQQEGSVGGTSIQQAAGRSSRQSSTHGTQAAGRHRALVQHICATHFCCRSSAVKRRHEMNKRGLCEHSAPQRGAAGTLPSRSARSEGV